MTDAELRDAAVKHLQATTISYPDWQRRVKAGKYTPKDGSGTEWGKAFAAFGQIAPDPPNRLTAYQLTLSPNWSQPTEQGPPILNAVWLYATSPHTPAKAPNGTGVGRYLDFAAQDEWWIIVNRLWPAAFDPSVYTGGFGTEANGHNVAGDNGPPGSGGVGWGFGSPVSALRIGWNPPADAPCMMVEPYQSGGIEIPLPVPDRDVWQTYEIHYIAGRLDKTTARPGIALVSVNGAKPIGVGGNTVQRAVCPSDGKAYTQGWMQWWDGDYGENLSEPSTTQFQLTRFGATREAAYADVPMKLSDNIASQVWNGEAPNVGPPTLKALP